ncbi:hypothetical protein VB716_12270 [Synechococcus sp. CCY9201]|jgi:hypothetical protein|uniref:Hfq-related RNA-binding protein n=1 Tax=unclassified Synechococcus TaxID=2626047 RepID=UPI0018CF2124|nr:MULTISPECIES: hypothetical protein [unclassified Synechococcus]MEA5424441.1 hypothetical protein [Synechococcus sp. CCY9202]MEA5474996.1 hypothetical protein [Synechococcus sp. CCY9201]QPN59547.1 hypothetical protein H8F24_16350 [Synechococcus sp. CBW1002]QPN66367.1 hypothetical protein H8F26_16620 [Synechococcus sp. CBW1006]CAK6694233.1 hypothetical protein IFHNHDMJ_01585 [Synechococcus sp. CBW1107]
MDNPYTDRRGPILDTTQPGIRHIQDMIREHKPVSVLIQSGSELEGVILWQDLEYIGLQHEDGRPLMLINRRSISMLRALG